MTFGHPSDRHAALQPEELPHTRPAAGIDAHGGRGQAADLDAAATLLLCDCRLEGLISDVRCVSTPTPRLLNSSLGVGIDGTGPLLRRDD